MRHRIAVDVMGSDRAPSEDVRGAVQAVQSSPGGSFELLLVGPEDLVRSELDRYPEIDRDRLRTVHAPDRIEMDEEPAQAVRSKRNSSIIKGLQLQKDGEADAFVSPGNTGAVMAASTLILGRLPGIARPTIASPFPAHDGFTLVADAGANIDSKPRHLFEFAVMTAVYAEVIMGYDNPTVGLLNVGEEEGKGGDRLTETYQMLRASHLNFVGNVEGRDILTGEVRVVICDGFTGNVLLKFAESVTGLLRAKMKSFASRSPINAAMALVAKGPLKRVFKEMNYETYGGVPLLGVNGVSIIGHGGSSAKAIENMIRRADEMVERQVNRKIEAALLEENDSGSHSVNAG